MKSAEAVGLSGFLIVATLLAVLAGFALLLTLRLVREHTAEESRLMRSRGAPIRFLVGAAVIEGVLLVLPALIATPFVALLARGLRHLPGLHGLPEPSRPVGIALEVDTLLAVSCVAIQALVAWTSSRERPTSHRVRGARGPAFQRAGVDAGLVVLAVVGYLQLRHDRSPVSAGSAVPSIDPVLVVAPAVTTAAAAALALRLLPPAARLADRSLERSRDLAAALGGWQVSRRVARAAGTVLLLVLALAVGTMTVTTAAMRSRSATDRAAFQIGADAQVTASAVGDSYQRSAMSTVPGVAAATPRADMDAVAGTQAVSLVGVDSAALPGVLAMRRDLAAGSTAAVFAPLTARGGNLGQDGPDPAVALPGRPTSLDFDITVSARTLPGDGHGPRDAPEDFLTHAKLAVDLRDREGVPLVLPVPSPSAPGTKTHVSIPLAVDGRTPDYPLRFEGFELDRRDTPDSLELDLTVGFSPAVAGGGAWHLIDESVMRDGLNEQLTYDDCDGRAAPAAPRGPRDLRHGCLSRAVHAASGLGTPPGGFRRGPVAEAGDRVGAAARPRSAGPGGGDRRFPGHHVDAGGRPGLRHARRREQGAVGDRRAGEGAAGPGRGRARGGGGPPAADPGAGAA